VLHPRRAHVEHSRVGDGGRDPVLERDRARHPVPGLAHAGDRDPVGVDVGPRQQVVDDRGDDVLPVGPEVEMLQEERGALPGAVEGESVVAAGEGRRPALDPHRRDRPVAAVVQDDRRPGLVGRPRPQEVARQRRLLVGDLDPLERRIRELGEAVEAAPVRHPDREEPCALVSGVDDVERVGVVRRGAQVRAAGTRPVSGGGAVLGDAADAVRGPLPLLEPRVGIALADPARRRPCFPGVGGLVGAGAERELHRELELFSFEEAHATSLRRRG
jgi:hypothetical protein